MWVEYSGTGADITSSPRVPGRVMITNIGLHGWDCRLRRASRVKTIISLQTPALILINLRIDHRRQMPSPKNLLICVKVGTPRAGAYKQSPRKGRAVLTELLCTYVVPVLAGLPGLGRGNQEEKYMPYYHFVVRAPDYTYDDPDGTHFPNHEAAREHGRDRQSTRSRCEQPRLASPIFLGLANDKRIYELCNPQRFGNRAPPLPPGSRSTTGLLEIHSEP